MGLIKDIPELIKAGVISQETADRIQDFYKNKDSQSANRLFVAFGILGAVLVGLGIILIIAHNWDELPRTLKTFFAFLPLIIGQILCIYILTKKQQSIPWKESGTTFLVFGIGACISLISQIYHIPGNLSEFLLTWILLSLPLLYVMRSAMVSLLYLIGITFYACETGYWSSPTTESYLYWLLLIGALPFYFLLLKNKPEGNFTTFHHWIIPLSLTVTLGTVADSRGELMFIGYFNLFGCLYLVGNWDIIRLHGPFKNGYKIIGWLGTIGLLIILSFDWFWEELRTERFGIGEALASAEFFTAVLTFLLAVVLLITKFKHKKPSGIDPIALVFILFTAIFLLGLFSSAAVVLINILVFMLGLLTMRESARLNHLGQINLGLLTITALVVCRFFDSDLSFVLKGILFVLVGFGFFIANYWMLKKRKADD